MKKLFSFPPVNSAVQLSVCHFKMENQIKKPCTHIVKNECIYKIAQLMVNAIA